MPGAGWGTDAGTLEPSPSIRFMTGLGMGWTGGIDGTGALRSRPPRRSRRPSVLLPTGSADLVGCCGREFVMMGETGPPPNKSTRLEPYMEGDKTEKMRFLNRVQNTVFP